MTDQKSPQGTALAPRSALAVDQYKMMIDQANRLIQTGFLPDSVKTGEQALAIVLMGNELGIGPMRALTSISVIKGKPTAGADLIRSLIFRDHGDEAFRVIETTPERCTISYKRRNWPAPETFTYTMKDANTAGLNRKSDKGPTNWDRFPREMLVARATSAVARLAFADSIGGMYTPEEGETAVDTSDRLTIQNASFTSTTPEPAAGTLPAEEVDDAEIVTVELTPENAPFPIEDGAPDPEPGITRAQAGEISALHAQLGYPVPPLDSWTSAGAEHAIESLRRQVKDREAPAGDGGVPGANRRERLTNLVVVFKQIAVAEGSPESAWKDVFERLGASNGIAKNQTSQLTEDEMTILYGQALGELADADTPEQAPVDEAPVEQELTGVASL